MYSKITLYFSLLVLFTSCLSHDEIITKQDADLTRLSELNTEQISNMGGKTVKKTIFMEGQTETHTLTADSLFIKGEFTKIADLDLKKVFLNGEYDKSTVGQTITYKHQDKTTTGPIELNIEKDENGKIIGHRIKYYSSNYLFDSAFEFYIQSKNSSVTSYHIDAYQKLIGMDASEYSIEGVVLDWDNIDIVNHQSKLGLW